MISDMETVNQVKPTIYHAQKVILNDKIVKQYEQESLKELKLWS